MLFHKNRGREMYILQPKMYNIGFCYIKPKIKQMIEIYIIYKQEIQNRKTKWNHRELIIIILYEKKKKIQKIRFKLNFQS